MHKKKPVALSNDYIKFEPRTAGSSVRRKDLSKKLTPYNRPRERKIFKIKNDDDLCIFGVTAKEQLHNKLSQKLKPPIIQSYHRNAIKNGLWNNRN